jgi:hypothetical protein
LLTRELADFTNANAGILFRISDFGLLSVFGLRVSDFEPGSRLYRFVDLVRWGKASAEAIFSDNAGEKEILEVLAAAGLGAAAGHFESAEWLPFHYRACDRAIDIKITARHLGFCASDIFRAP